MVDVKHPFVFWDYLIFVLSIAVSLGIGIYYAVSGGKQRTTSEYFVGNRKMSILPVAISLIVSFESSIMMLGTPAEVYVYGIQWIIAVFAFLFADCLSAVLVPALIHPLKITSAYEYLEKRFDSHATRILGTVLGILSTVTYMGIVLFGPAIAVEAVLGVPLWISIVFIACASIIYTSIGGFKAVIWTDVFQSFIMITGILAVIIKGTLTTGGVKKTWEIANARGRINLFNFDPDPTIRHTFWNLFIGNLFRGLGLAFNQTSVQRIGSTPTVSQAKKVILLTAPGHVLLLSLACIEGIVAYSYYDTLGCDPIASKHITDPNQLIPFMVVDIFQHIHGLSGIFMASLFCASLSTLSSGLSSMSALFWTDLVKPHTKPMSERKATFISKASVVMFGGIAVFIAFMISLIGGTLIQISGSLLSAFGGPLTGLFLFGVFCPWGNSKGAFIGTLVSAVITFTVSIGQTSTEGAVKNTKLAAGPIDFCSDVLSMNTSFTEWNSTLSPSWSTEPLSMPSGVIPEPSGFSRIFMLSYQWFSLFGILQVLVFGTIVSLLTGHTKPGEVDSKYLIPLFDRIFPFLPESVRKPFRCGYFDKVKEKVSIPNGIENGSIKKSDLNGLEISRL